jgi:hypothetical protein
MNRTFGAIAITLGLTDLTAHASAQDEALQEEGIVELSDASVAGGDVGASQGKLRLYGGLRLGFGGEIEVEPEGGGSVDIDLATTFGGQVGADYVLMDYVALGGELRLGSVTIDDEDNDDVGRDLYIDVVFKPRGRYVLSGIPLEVYGTLPLGVTFINLNSDVDENSSAGPGFTLGIGGGATYFFTDKLGVNAEMAYLMYWFGSETELPAALGGAKFEADNSFGQLSLFANVVYAL